MNGECEISTQTNSKFLYMNFPNNFYQNLVGLAPNESPCSLCGKGPKQCMLVIPEKLTANKKFPRTIFITINGPEKKPPTTIQICIQAAKWTFFEETWDCFFGCRFAVCVSDEPHCAFLFDKFFICINCWGIFDFMSSIFEFFMTICIVSECFCIRITFGHNQQGFLLVGCVERPRAPKMSSKSCFTYTLIRISRSFDPWYYFHGFSPPAIDIFSWVVMYFKLFFKIHIFKGYLSGVCGALMI